MKGIPRIEFAKLVKKSTKTIDRWCRKRRVKWYKLGGGIYIMPIDEEQLCQLRAAR